MLVCRDSWWYNRYISRINNWVYCNSTIKGSGEIKHFCVLRLTACSPFFRAPAFFHTCWDMPPPLSAATSGDMVLHQHSLQLRLIIPQRLIECKFETSLRPTFHRQTQHFPLYPLPRANFNCGDKYSALYRLYLL